MNQEFIKPYYYLLYNKNYEKISYISLHENPAFANSKIEELKNKSIIHVKKITEISKWVVHKKTGDKQQERNTRQLILKNFSTYCSHIFIDEAQDIDKHMFEIINALDKYSIQLSLIGDPKQDLNGFGQLNKLMEQESDSVKYKTVCHRCPQNHLDISNALIDEKERQENQNKIYGAVTVIFENDLQDVKQYIESQSFDLKYISKKKKKNSIYATKNEKTSSQQLDNLSYEIESYLFNKFPNKSELRIRQHAYYWAEKMIEMSRKGGNSDNIVKVLANKLNIKFDKASYAKIKAALELNQFESHALIVVSSIHSIKGQEGENCLFILTTDLAAYLFGNKTENNKTKNLLYVALTRSLNELSILITEDVVKNYTRDVIKKYFEQFGIQF